MKRLTVFLICLCVCTAVRAQFAVDTLSLRSGFKASQLIAPAVLGASGLAVHFLGHEAVEVPVRDFTLKELSKPEVVGICPWADYIRFVPAAAHVGMGLVGVKSQHALVDRCIESALAHLFAFGGGYVAKKIFASLRPDGSSYDSFPSGHTIVAFTGSELVRMDYGWAWGTGAYALSSAVGVSRIVADRHWVGDILAGAGWGILSAHIGGWLLEPVKSLFGIPDIEWDGLGTPRKVQLAVAPGIDPVSGSTMASLSLRF